MTRGNVGWVTLCCLALGAGGCSRKPPPEQGAPAPQETPKPSAPAPQAAPQKESPAMAIDLECSMSAPPSVKAGEPVEVWFQLSNRMDRPLFVLTWRTPLEGLRGNDFQVTRDGTEVPYQGPMMKRGNPQSENYATIAPGASMDAKVELSLAYDMKQPGRYRIEYRGPVMDVADREADVPRTLEQLKPVPVKCPVVETTVTAPAPLPP